MRIGILAVQGDYEAHGRMLQRLGVEHVQVRTVAELAGCAGVILPGGESTTQLKFLQEEGLQEALLKFAKEGGAFFGTCAGAILLAREVHRPQQASLALMDTVVLRNGYGRQLASEVMSAPTLLKHGQMEMVFIRAPIIERVGAGVEVLGERNGKPVLARQGRMLAATFHPELSEDTTVHEYFLQMIENGA